MKNHKILVDRKPLSEKYIQSKQDFGKVLKGVEKLKPPLWKSAWFYGPVGLATVALTISATTIQNDKIPDKELKISSFSLEKQVNREVKTIVPNSVEHKSLPVVEDKVKKKKLLHPTPIKKKDVEILKEKKEIINESKNQVIEEKTTFKNAYPNINNVFTGDITFSNLRSENGITCGDKKITSFSIQYFDGKIDVNENVVGNRIPEKSCELIERYNNGTWIFITDIKGVDVKGDSISFPSLNFVPRY